MHGVHASLTAAKITVTGVPGHAGATAAVFRAVAEQQVDLGLVSQNATGAPTGTAAIAFTVARSAGQVVLGTLCAARARIGFHRVYLEDDVAVITLTGAGLRSDPAVPATFCEVLARSGIRMDIVSIEGSQISATCGQHELETAMRALCEVFEVGAAAQAVPQLSPPRPRASWARVRPDGPLADVQHDGRPEWCRCTASGRLVLHVRGSAVDPSGCGVDDETGGSNRVAGR